MTGRVVADGEAGRLEAIAALRRGDLVALPTDTVYGLAVALDAPDGLARLFAAKHRPLDRAIVLLLADRQQAETVGELDAAAQVLASSFWPGGLTLVVRQRAAAGLPPELAGGSGTVGLRVAGHDAPRALAAAVGPLPVTSANRSGQAPALNVAELLAQLGDVEQLAVVLDDGPSPGGVASTVVDCSAGPPRLIRDGAVGVAALVAVLEGAGLEHRLDP